MLLSMTGHGEGFAQRDGMTVAVEIRTINSRYFKLSVRSADSYMALESQIDSVVRQQIRRGTVQVDLRLDRTAAVEDYKINQVALKSYRRQLENMYHDLQVAQPVQLEPLLALPGVVDERIAGRLDLESDWPLIEAALKAGLDNLAAMRAEEGRAMRDDLHANCRLIGEELGEVELRAPLVVESYRARLAERIGKLLQELDLQLQAGDLLREVGLFAERSDISEEMVRLRSHLEQFDTIMDLPESNGRKLEFLTQEMFRETNTIGAKANDAEISRHVIEIKAAIERMREMIQNVE